MNTIEQLRDLMEAAAQAEDFEEDRRLRDQISLMRGGATADLATSADTSGIDRQRPGAMGLGTNHQRITPPKDWVRPTKPDMMTRGRNRRRPLPSNDL